MKNTILLIGALIPIFVWSQTTYTSSKYRYSIEIPLGFIKTSKVGANVDFKAIKGLSSIVVVLKTIPSEYTSYTIWDNLGDLETFGTEWENGAKEYMDNPKFLKYGKTTVNNLQSFWYDYTTDNPKLYSKTYQTQKDNRLFTFTLTCPNNDYNNFSSIWFRFKEKIKIE